MVYWALLVGQLVVGLFDDAALCERARERELLNPPSAALADPPRCERREIR